MNRINLFLALFLAVMMGVSCTRNPEPADKTAAEILGDPAYQAISYGGYREITRDVQPTIRQLKEDMKILPAMGIRVLRTYNVHYGEAANLLEAISQMKAEDPEFEMYVMLGAWIDCKNAWTDLPDRIRDQESERNAVEIARAVELTLQYPDIVKVIAVGNEAMVHWAWNYYVEPGIILKWVNHLQDLKTEGVLPETLWITSSDNFASWGGGGSEYHVSDLEKIDAANPLGSENHFGLINLQSHAKFALWDLVEDGTFEGLTRDGKPITRTFDGDKEAMMKTFYQ